MYNVPQSILEHHLREHDAQEGLYSSPFALSPSANVSPPGPLTSLHDGLLPRYLSRIHKRVDICSPERIRRHGGASVEP
jgi:hypothetical protein